MQPGFQTDEGFFNTLKGNQSSDNLQELKTQIALVQAASLLAIEGTNRATASQVVERAIREYGVDATPSFTGQLFATLGIGSAMTHGKSRFILDQARLEVIRKGLEEKIEEMVSRLQSSIEQFKNLPEKIDALEKEWKGILQSRRKEQELIRVIKEGKGKADNLLELHEEAKKIRERAQYVDQLKEECSELQKKIKKQPSLEERKQQLEAKIADYNERFRQTQLSERDLVAKEQQLAKLISKLHERNAWADLADVMETLKERKADLDDVLKQLGEKRSLLDKLLQRNKGVGS